MSERLGNEISFLDFCTKLNIQDYKNQETVVYSPYPYLLRLFDMCENNQFVIGKKFRQGGFTTFFLIYFLWKIYTQHNLQCGIVSHWLSGSRMLIDTLAQLSSTLPEEFKIKRSSCTITNTRTNSTIYIVIPNHCIGKGLDYVYIDDMALQGRDEEQNWQAIYPCIKNKCFILSTPGCKQGAFYKLYKNAVKHTPEKVFKASCKECPIYTPTSLEFFKSSLGYVAFDNEILAKFRNTYPCNNLTNKFLKWLVRNPIFTVEGITLRARGSTNQINIKDLSQALKSLKSITGQQEAFRLVFNAVSNHFFGGNSENSSTQSRLFDS